MKSKNLAFKLVILLFGLGVFLKGTAPTIFPGDSPEIISGTLTLGIVHGLGFPLYMMIANLFRFLPLGSLAWRINLCSVTFGGAILFVFLNLTAKVFSEQIQEQIRGTLFRKNIAPLPPPTKTLIGRNAREILQTFAIPSKEKNVKKQNPIHLLWGALLIIGCSALKYQVIRAEVYAMNMFFYLLLLYFAAQTKFNKPNTAGYYLFSFLGFLSTGIHVFLNAFLLLFLTPLFLFERKRGLKKHVIALTLAVIGLSVYLYLPLRAITDPPLNWAGMEDLAAIWSNAFYFKQLGLGATVSLGVRVMRLSRFFVRELGFWQLLLAGGGFFLLCQRNRRFALALGLIILSNIATYLRHVDFSAAHLDFLGYELIAILALIFCAWLGLSCLDNKITALSSRPLASRLATLLITVFLALNAANTWRNHDERNNFIAYNYAADVINSVEHGELIVEGNEMTFPLSYLVFVEDRAPQITFYSPFGNGIFATVRYPTRFSASELLRQRQKHFKQLLDNNKNLYSELKYAYENQPLGWRIKGLIYQRGAGMPIKQPLAYLHQPSGKPYDNKSRVIIAGYLIRKGEIALTDQNYTVAFQLWQRAAETAYDDAVTLTDIGVYFWENRVVDQAIRLYRQALKLKPDLAPAHSNLALALRYGRQDFENALKHERIAKQLTSTD